MIGHAFTIENVSDIYTANTVKYITMSFLKATIIFVQYLGAKKCNIRLS